MSNLGNPQCQSVRENGFNKGGFILESAPEKLGVQITPEVDSRLDPSVMFDFSIWWESGFTSTLIGLSDFGVFVVLDLSLYSPKSMDVLMVPLWKQQWVLGAARSTMVDAGRKHEMVSHSLHVRYTS